MIIKFSCAVPDIDQLILLLSIPEMWNLERNIMGVGPENVLIIIAHHLKNIEKKSGGLQVIHTALLCWERVHSI